mgnify:CR=1 FL=1
MNTKPTQYTEEYVLDELKELLGIILVDKSIVYLGQLIEEKPYSMQRFSEWNGIDNKEISETIQKIKDILQTRAVVGGLKNQLSANITKFHLINNFDWSDKTEQDLKVSGGLSLTELFNKANEK